ncbi:hypothetical protein GV51_1290 [Gardnerella vaginalis 5-1]|nr:hypothetical protein GV51_1290 [Gardnerella vaginalis 5-1]
MRLIFVIPRNIHANAGRSVFKSGFKSCGFAVCAGVGMRALLRMLLRTLLQHRKRKIRVRGGNIDVALRIRARILQNFKRLIKLLNCIMRATGFAVKHRKIVVKRGKLAVFSAERFGGFVKSLSVNFFGAIVAACRAKACGGVN